MVAVPGTDKRAQCPECDFHGKVATGKRHYSAEIHELHLGRVEAKIQQRNSGTNIDPGTNWEPDEIRYMAWETGVGTGSLWSEDDLFPTREAVEALALPPDDDADKPAKPATWRSPAPRPEAVAS